MSTFTMRSTLRDTIAEWDVKQGCDGRELETTKEALPLPEELRAGALGRPESSLPGSLSGPDQLQGAWRRLLGFPSHSDSEQPPEKVHFDTEERQPRMPLGEDAPPSHGPFWSLRVLCHVRPGPRPQTRDLREGPPTGLWARPLPGGLSVPRRLQDR